MKYIVLILVLILAGCEDSSEKVETNLVDPNSSIIVGIRNCDSSEGHLVPFTNLTVLATTGKFYIQCSCGNRMEFKLGIKKITDPNVFACSSGSLECDWATGCIAHPKR